MDDLLDVLLEEVWLEAVERLVEVLREKAQRDRPPFGRRPGGVDRARMEPADLRENLRRVLSEDLALVIEGDREVVEARDRGLDLLLQQVRDLLVQDLGRGRIPHVRALGVVLGGVHVRGDDPVLLDPEPVDVVLEPQPRREEGREARRVVVAEEVEHRGHLSVRSEPGSSVNCCRPMAAPP